MVNQRCFAKLSLVLFAILTLLSCGGEEGRKEKYLERAKSYIAEQNYVKARVEVKNALQIDSRSAEAYFLLGKIDDANEAFNDSFGDYSRALEYDPDLDQARVRMAHYYLLSNDNVKAEEMAAYILKKNPDHPEAKTIHAVVLLKKGDAAAARKIVLEVVAADPHLMEATMLLSNLYEREGDMNKAADVLIQAIAKNENNINLYEALVEIYLKQKNFSKAEEMLKMVISLAPDKIQYRENLSSFYVHIKQPEKAEKVLREAIRIKPTDTKRYVLLAGYLASQNRGTEAESELLAAIKTYPNEYDLQYQLASFYQASGEPDKAEAVYRKIMIDDRAGPEGKSARRKLASLLHSENKVAEATALISTVLEENPDDMEALMLRGVMGLETSDKNAWQAAVIDFRSLLKNQPDSPEVLVMLARAHSLNNEPDLARGALQSAVKSSPKDADITLSLAQFLLSNDKDVGGSLRVLDQFLVNSPGDLAILHGKLKIFISKNNTKEIVDVISLIKKTHPNDPAGYMRAGEFMLSQYKYQDAMHEFEQARDLSPGDFEAVGEIAKIYIQTDKLDSAINVLDDFLKNSPDNLEAMGMKAEIYNAANQSEEFFKVVNDIKRLYPGQTDGYRLAGDFYFAQKKYADARNEFKAALDKSSDWQNVVPSLIRAYIAGGEENVALAWLADMVKKEPNEGLYPYLTGEVLLSQKKYTEAEAQYQKAVQLMPLNNQVYLGLAGVSAKQNHHDEAVKILEQGLAAIPNDYMLLMKLASEYEIAEKYDEALAIYDDLYWADASNNIVANNMALLLAEHKSDKSSLERALNLAARFEESGDPVFLDTLGWVYYKMDDVDHALPILKEAADNAPELAIIRYHLGMAYNKKGDKSAAKDNLTRAFASEEQFTGAAEGRSVLKSLQ